MKLKLLAVVAMLVWSIAACGDDGSEEEEIDPRPGEVDFGTVCLLDPDSEDAATAACAEPTEPDISCVVNESEDCSGNLCARFEGSEPYCTVECTDDSDCLDGSCIEFVPQSDVKHCVPA